MAQEIDHVSRLDTAAKATVALSISIAASADSVAASLAASADSVAASADS